MPPVSRSASQRRGLVAFLILSFALSWVPAALLAASFSLTQVPGAFRLLVASVVYAFCTGWQPIVAVWIVRRWIDRTEMDHGVSRARVGYYVLASLAAFGITGFAMAIALLFGGSLVIMHSDGGEPMAPSFQSMLLLLAAMCTTLTLVWLQAFAEEVGWRGYFLNRLMGELGPLRGLGVHGVFWGLWYAPMFLIASPQLSASLERGLAFVVTCMLLGALLGWLRLASRSVLPATLANGLLTLAAGLPLLLQGDELGVRAAVYGPVGWFPMGLALLLILLTKAKAYVRIPEPESLRDRRLRALLGLAVTDRRRTLH
jgi:uncharacterized protein